MANVCVYGEPEKDYLIALIVPNHKRLESMAKNQMTLEELCTDSQINKKVFDSIKETAQSSKLLKVEIPTKIKLCSEQWLPDNGLVTAALKLRRKNIKEFYQKDINCMYGTAQRTA